VIGHTYPTLSALQDYIRLPTADELGLSIRSRFRKFPNSGSDCKSYTGGGKKERQIWNIPSLVSGSYIEKSKHHRQVAKSGKLLARKCIRIVFSLKIFCSNNL
jgi:hypothetical protein